MNTTKAKGNTEIKIFMFIVACVALGNGLSDSIYANYFKEAYEITTMQRGFIEFPRELPGVLCAFIIAGLSYLGDIRTALIAQGLSLFGLLVLGLFTPTFGIMLIFLFINSTGMHMFMPLQDAIGMSLAEEGEVGTRMGQYASLKAACGFVSGLVVFFGFRYNIFSFTTSIKWVFLLGSIFFILSSIAISKLLSLQVKQKYKTKKAKLLFAKEYKYYYMLTTLHGVQKQIAYVYGSWVLIEMLLKGADIMALLLIISSFVGIFFMRKIGNWIDKFGIKKMMYVDALTFIVIYTIYGIVVWALDTGAMTINTSVVLLVYILFISDRLSMQIGMVKSVYLRSIALNEEHVTEALSTGISLDHIVAIIAAMIGGVIWITYGGQWVFFMAAFFSLGNLYVAYKIKE